MLFHTIPGSPPQSLIPDISISACFEQDRNNTNEEKTEEKERKQRPEADLGEERRGGEQQECLSSELQGARLSSPPSSPACLKLPASKRSAARRGLTLCCGAENEVPVIS